MKKAVSFRERFGPSVYPSRWDDLPSLLAGAKLLVNATSLGMKGQPEVSIELGMLAYNAIVSDVVYVPLKTNLLAQAEGHGLRTSNGLDMLLHQAVCGFELWFGVRPEVTPELFALIAADIAKG